MMYSIKFKVKLIEPLIISANDKTETCLNCLDYIPGNIFLGMAAGKLYRPTNDNHNEILDLFHNGNVQFGNAYLSKDNLQSKPIPAVWYKEKGKKLDEAIHLFHELEDDDWKEFAKKGISIKQERNDYFVENNGKIKILTAKKGVVLKSAYDSDKRSAKNEQMYLYQYLEAEQEFIFEVKANKIEYLEKLEVIFKGERHISKSRSAEFGAIKMNVVYEIKDVIEQTIKENEKTYIIYAKSNLAFVNEFGAFTWKPTAKDLGFENGKINYEKSQLYFDKFHTRNGKRKTHDSDRLIIKKGSVFVIEKDINNIKIEKEIIDKGVGAFLSEGYGQIIVNPSFLNNISKDNITYVEQNNTAKDTAIEDTSINTVFQERLEAENTQKGIYEAVRTFINDKSNLYRNISPSQWGAIRSLVYQARNTENPNTVLYNLVFNNTTGYIYSGRMGEKWSNSQRNTLQSALDIANDDTNEKNTIDYDNIEKLLLLTIEISKRNK